MIDRNKDTPMSAEAWLDIKYPGENVLFSRRKMIQEYADYIKSFQPESVESIKVEKSESAQFGLNVLNGSIEIALSKHPKELSDMALELYPIKPFYIRGEHYAPLDLNQGIRDAFIKGSAVARPIDNSVEFAEWYHKYKMSCYKGKLSGYSDDRNADQLYQLFLNQKDKK